MSISMKPGPVENHVRVDARGKACPLPIVLLARALKATEAGETVELLATDPGTLPDLRAFCDSTGNLLERTEQEGEILRAWVKKRPD